MKQYIEIHGLPHIIHAHTFTADRYENRLPQRKDGIEISYLAKGSLECCYEGQAPFTVPEHAVSCNCCQAPLNVWTKNPHEHHTVAFSLPFSYTEEKTPNAIALPQLLLGDQSKIAACIDEIIVAHTMHTKSPLACACLILQLLDALDGSICKTEEAPSYNHRRTELAKEYIYKHLKEPIRQADIAAHLGISPEYLCAIFKKTEGMPVMQFINRIKLEQIRQLMENSHLTLAEAAELYGYPDPNYVSRLHKKYFHYNITDKKTKVE